MANIIDYVASGLFSNRPATPDNVGSGGSSFYYATDTSALYVWDDVASAWDEVSGSGAGGAAKRTTLSRSSTGQTISTATWTVVAFDTEDADTANGGDIGTDANRITVPAGYTRARVTAYVCWDNNSTNGRRAAIQLNNDSTLAAADVVKFAAQQAVNETGMCLITEILTVSPTDHFSLWVQQDSGGNRTLQGTGFGGPTIMTVEFWSGDA